MSEAAFQSLPLPPRQGETTMNETTPGGSEEVRWEIVASTAGLTPATIIAGRLQSEGIPARAWQEGAGQALGLTVGLLGTGYVTVPEHYAEEARKILDNSTSIDFQVEEWDEPDDAVDDETSKR
ncbi:MAG TPA: DUF2007 domain-containing protein [Anaerolineae bacterium]